MMGGQVAVLGVLGARLYQVQVQDGARYTTLADENRISARMIAPPRGRILDRFGVVVAGSSINWRAVLVAEQANNVPATLDAFSALVPLTDYERARIDRELHRTPEVHPGADPRVPHLGRDGDDRGERARPARHRGRCRHHPALPVRPASWPTSSATSRRRTRPMSPTTRCWACPACASAAPGMEKYHDLGLRGRAGAVQLEVNAVGRVIRELDRQEGVPGEDVGLTLDAGLQQSVLASAAATKAPAPWCMDCRNGEVLAMATNPSFDPSVFNSGVSQAQWLEWTKDRRTPLINKATSGLYAPGSTFKMAVALAGLESKAITPADRIGCPG